MSNQSVLYSFRRCPYAIRARMALLAAGQVYELREVVLKDKPQSMLDLSAKGTVPVFVAGGEVIDESIEIMRWALQQADVMGLGSHTLEYELLEQNDREFKPLLDQYKYFERFPEHSQDIYLEQAMPYLTALEAHLKGHLSGFLLGPNASALDVAIFPFIRQFAFADKARFDALTLPNLQTWLDAWLHADLFQQVMGKYPAWQPGQAQIVPEINPVVCHEAENGRFVIYLPEGEIALLKYKFVADNVVDFYSTLVPKSQRGRGLAGILVDRGFEWARRFDIQIKASCWYAADRLVS